MKSFLNYSKNRFLYGLIKFGFLLFALYVGYSLFGCIQVHAATLTDTSSWVISKWLNDSTTLTQVNCPPYGANGACLVTPNQTGNRISFGFRVTDQPFIFKANSTYKIKVNVINVLQSDGWKPTISFETSDGVYTDSYEFSDYSMYSNNNFDTWILTFSPSSNLSIKTMNLTFTNNTSFIPDYSLGMSPNFEIIDADNTNDVIIDQNEQIIAGQDQIKDEIGNVGEEIQGSIDNAKDEINDTIKDSFEDCKNKTVINNFSVGSLSGTSGSSINSKNRLVTDKYIFVNSSSDYVLSLSSSYSILVYVFEYDSNYNFIQRIPSGWITTPFNFTTNENTSYIKIIFAKSDDSNITIDDISDVEVSGRFCSNRLDNVTDSIGNLNDSITDSTPPNLDGLADSAGWLPAGPVDSILNLPISLLNNLNDNLGGTCQPANLTLPFINQNITLPCMSDVYKKIGISGWVNTVGTIAAAFIGYYYLLELYKWVDNVLTMRENQWNDVDQWGGI